MGLGFWDDFEGPLDFFFFGGGGVEHPPPPRYATAVYE